MTENTTTSPTIGALVAALAKAKASYRPLYKNATVNTGKYVFVYADLPACIEATESALCANQLAIVQTMDDTRLVSILAHSSGEWIRSVSDLGKFMESSRPQDHGSILTYFRRYHYQGLTGLSAEKDDDGERGQAEVTPRTPKMPPAPPTSSPPAAPKTPGPAQSEDLKLLASLLDQIGVPKGDRLEWCIGFLRNPKLTGASDLSPSELQACISECERRLEKGGAQ